MVFRVLKVFREFQIRWLRKSPKPCAVSGYAIVVLFYDFADSGGFLESELLSDFLRHSVLVDKDVHCLVSNESL